MKKLILLSLVVVSFLSGCAITQNVVPVGNEITIKKIYVLENPNVHMDGLLPELLAQLEQLGFEAESYTGQRPDDAQYYMTFTANWAWDMAMYLTYFQASLFDNGKHLGEVEYDARMGGANMGKFGKTAEKVRPLLEQLFSNVKREKWEKKV